MISNYSRVQLRSTVRLSIYPIFQFDTRIGKYKKSGYVVNHQLSPDDLKNLPESRKKDLLGFIYREYHRWYFTNLEYPVDVSFEDIEKEFNSEVSQITEEKFTNGVSWKGNFNPTGFYDDIKDSLEVITPNPDSEYYSSIPKLCKYKNNEEW